ncbi:SDR family oxidoreductase [Agrobacterium tumefaciens]|uniref:SDR family oxidoreductase n=1 Tax=Agrobacterium tumefaciens TaxID=358 RepID=UPI003D9C38A3
MARYFARRLGRLSSRRPCHWFNIWTKAALNHVTRLLALSLAPAIRVNAVAPGLVDTPLTADWTAARELWRTRAPMRRPASPEDIAQAVMMLVQSHYLTGAILLSDGGLNLTCPKPTRLSILGTLKKMPALEQSRAMVHRSSEPYPLSEYPGCKPRQATSRHTRPKTRWKLRQLALAVPPYGVRGL